jgi:hypothetical protein
MPAFVPALFFGSLDERRLAEAFLCVSPICPLPHRNALVRP